MYIMGRMLNNWLLLVVTAPSPTCLLEIGRQYKLFRKFDIVPKELIKPSNLAALWQFRINADKCNIMNVGREILNYPCIGLDCYKLTCNCLDWSLICGMCSVYSCSQNKMNQDIKKDRKRCVVTWTVVT